MDLPEAQPEYNIEPEPQTPKVKVQLDPKVRRVVIGAYVLLALMIALVGVLIIIITFF